MSHAEQVTVKMLSSARGGWNLLLQKGFYKTGASGLTVRQFIMEVLGYKSDFIDEKVRTIFLNYSPVDDIDEAIVMDGDKLSLGSAMPGLVGVVMGRDNPFKSFRDGITCHGAGLENASVESIRVFMKVFSSLVVETGLEILACGIETTAKEIRTILNSYDGTLVEIEGLEGLDDETIVIASAELVESD